MTQMKYELKIQMKILILWLVVKNIWIPYTHTHTHAMGYKDRVNRVIIAC